MPPIRPSRIKPVSGVRPLLWLAALLVLLLATPAIGAAPPADQGAASPAIPAAGEVPVERPAATAADSSSQPEPAAGGTPEPLADDPWTTGSGRAPAPDEPFSPGLSLLKAFGALVLLIGLMLFIAAAVRKLGFNQGLGGQGELIRVLETRPLGPKKYLVVVEAADEFFLVAVGDQQINLLTRLGNEELIRQSLASRQGPAVNGGFAGRLAAIMKQRDTEPSRGNFGERKG